VCSGIKHPGIFNLFKSTTPFRGFTLEEYFSQPLTVFDLEVQFLNVYAAIHMYILSSCQADSLAEVD